MLKRAIFFLLSGFLLLQGGSFSIMMAQNFIPNGDFEEHTDCPHAMSLIELAEPWFNPTNATADYFNVCDTGTIAGIPDNFIGEQIPQSGSGYAGIFVAQTGGPPYREYMEVPLTAPLQPNYPYELTWYVNLADNSSCSPTAICAYLTNDLLADYSTTAFLTQPLLIEQTLCSAADNVFNDKNHWEKIKTCFVASGKEKYFVVGNNYSDEYTGCVNGGGGFYSAYLYIDDISLIPMPVQTVHFDTAVCKGQWVTIDGSALVDEPVNVTPQYVWTDGVTGPKRSIKENGTYTLTIINGCVVDTLIVQLDYLSDCPEIFEIPNAFSPNGDGMNDRFRIIDENITVTDFEIYDRWGACIFNSVDAASGWDGTIRGKPADVGMYLYFIRLPRM